MKYWITFFVVFFTISITYSNCKENKIYLKEINQLLDDDKIELSFKKIDLYLSKQKTDKEKGYFLLFTGEAFRLHFLYDDALKFFKKTLTISKKINCKMLAGDVYNSIGLVHYNRHLFTNSLSEFSKSLKIFVNIKDEFGIAMANLNIGNFFLDTKNYYNALKYYKSTLKYAQKLDLNYLIANANHDIGTAYYHLKKYPESIEYYNKTLAYELKHNNYINIANTQFNMGLSYIDLKQYPTAENFLKKALLNYQKVKSKEGILMSYTSLFRTNMLLKNKKQKEYYKQKSIQSIFKGCYKSALFDLYTYLVEDAHNLKDFKSELKYTKTLLEINNEIIEEIKNQELKNLKLDINYSKINHDLNKTKTFLENEKREKQKIKTLNLQLKKKNNLIIILSTLGFTLMVIFISILYKSNLSKKKTNLQLENHTKLLAEKNQEIINSMEFASSMEKLLLQQMNPHFLYNALTTIEASLSIGDIDFAKQFLSLFSDLLRKTLDNSRQDSINLEDEIKFLQSYIALNVVKQGNNFRCEFDFNQDEIEDFVQTPPMLVQPFIENSLIHGLYHKTEGEKILSIKIEPKDTFIIWTITDNGIGRKNASEIGKTHKGISHGINITVDRIHWMKRRFGDNFSIEYIDLDEGTKVILKTPIINE